MEKRTLPHWKVRTLGSSPPPQDKAPFSAILTVDGKAFLVDLSFKKRTTWVLPSPLTHVSALYASASPFKIMDSLNAGLPLPHPIPEVRTPLYSGHFTEVCLHLEVSLDSGVGIMLLWKAPHQRGFWTSFPHDLLTLHKSALVPPS